MIWDDGAVDAPKPTPFTARVYRNVEIATFEMVADWFSQGCDPADIRGWIKTEIDTRRRINAAEETPIALPAAPCGRLHTGDCDWSCTAKFPPERARREELPAGLAEKL